MTPPLIEGHDLSKTFGVRSGLLGSRRKLRAVDGVSLQVAAGETVALVGESGSGKSTLGRLLLGLLPPTSGQVRYAGGDVWQLPGDAKRRFRRDVQVVFQDTGASLNPRRTVGASVAVPLRFNLGLGSQDARRRAAALLERVGLDPARLLDRYPHELSGGQRQRVCIARAIACEPRFVVADEAVSALDVSVRAQILLVMRELQRANGLAYLFITHDLGVVRAIADRVLVMYMGSVVESGTVAAIFEAPGHPYTRALLAATPLADPGRRHAPREVLPREMPSPLNLPRGCRFHTRCPMAQEVCLTAIPPIVQLRESHYAACHFAGQVLRPPPANTNG